MLCRGVRAKLELEGAEPTVYAFYQQVHLQPGLGVRSSNPGWTP